jgi:hypothetical protein
MEPSEAWMAAYEAQATPKLVANMERYARKRGRGVARCGGVVDELTARELVFDALGDTLEGIVAWDPARVPLEVHVHEVIKSRTRHLRIHARRFQRASLSDPSRATLVEVEASLAATVDPAREPIGDAVLAELRALAANDADVLRLLAAYAEGVMKKVHVMRVTQMTSRVYERTRKRMNRLVDQLSPELRQAARMHA